MINYMKNINKYIDHTNLKATATKEDIKILCDEALEHNFAAVCVNPCFVNYCSHILKEAEVKVCTVIGFPLGANTTELKVSETIKAINDGAEEVEMVINIGEFKCGNYSYVKDEILKIREAAKNVILKVIIETCYLTSEEIKIATLMCNETNVDFIKTSTGFGTSGASEEDIKIMKEHANESLRIKASGGIKSYDDAIKMITLGANRIGTSSGVNIIEEAN